jgi:hypothetical protein
MMGRTIEDLNKLTTEELGIGVEFAESVLMQPDEVNDVLTDIDINPITEDVLVHSTSDDDTVITIITSDYPEYVPYVLLKESEDGEVLFKKDFR